MCHGIVVRYYWLGLAGIFWWLTKKEKETGLGKEALVTKEKQPLYKKL